MKLLHRLINSTSIRPQLFITVASGILLLLVAVISASTWLTNRQVRGVLMEQGRQAAVSLAQSSTLALLYDSPENVASDISATLAFPGIQGINIYRPDKTLFYESNGKIQVKLGNSRIPFDEPGILAETRDRWQFIAPVFVRADAGQRPENDVFRDRASGDNQLLGYVVVSLSKASLNRIGKGILFSNITITLFVGLALLFALHRTIKRLTSPLYRISRIMQKTEQNGAPVTVETDGPTEVHHIAQAYNRMIGILAERDEALRKQNLHLEKQATEDHLTKLTNRIGFEQAMTEAIDDCQRHNTVHALCYMDLDKFKIVNDTCGHNAGDELLQHMSDLFRLHIRKDADILARIGGDEFALILKNCSLEKARTISETICRDVQAFQFHCSGQVFSIGVSIGITPIDRHDEHLKSVIARVDNACYTAKENGRGQVSVVTRDDATSQDSGQLTRLANRILHCLDEGGFSLYCQPVMNLQNRQDGLNRFELLLRMPGENGEYIEPGAFLPSAERYHLMDRLDRWVIREGLAQLALTHTPPEQIEFICINISAASLGDSQFFGFVQEQIQASPFEARQICFEVSETIAVNHPGQLLEFIQAAHNTGCLIALDNFVSSATSFAHIQQLPVDILKIHGDFFQQLAHSPVDDTMVRSINDIAHHLHIRTIAANVEDPALTQRLRDMGIDFAQGFAFEKPFLLTGACDQAANG